MKHLYLHHLHSLHQPLLTSSEMHLAHSYARDERSPSWHCLCLEGEYLIKRHKQTHTTRCVVRSCARALTLNKRRSRALSTHGEICKCSGPQRYNNTPEGRSGNCCCSEGGSTGMRWIRPEMVMVLAGGSALHSFPTQNANAVPAEGHTDAPRCPLCSSAPCH